MFIINLAPSYVHINAECQLMPLCVQWAETFHMQSHPTNRWLAPKCEVCNVYDDV